MHPYSINYGNQQFWRDLAGRLEPWLGDLSAECASPQWQRQFEFLFTRGDYLTLAIAKSRGKTAHQRYAVEMCDDRLWREDSVLSADSLQIAIAGLAADFCESGIWPDDLIFDPIVDQLEVRLNGALLARVSKPCQQETHAIARVESTVLGLRKSPDVQSELCKRIRQWPGLETIEVDDSDARNEHHQPSRSEWLISAKRLAQLSGVPATTAQAQAIAAAVFGVDSWNHLCGWLSAYSDADIVSSAMPWYLTTLQGDGAYTTRVYEHFTTAFSVFCKDLREFCAVKSAKLRIGGWWGSTPYLMFSDPHDPNYEAPGWLPPTVYMSLQPTKPMIPNPIWVNRVAAAWPAGIEACAKSVLMIPVDNRAQFRAAEHDWELLCADGLWRFGISNDAEKDLIATMVDDKKLVVFEARAPLYKAELIWVPGFSAYVLGSDYDGRSPVAILYGITRKSAERLASRMKSRGFGFWEFLENDQEYQKDLENLKQEMKALRERHV